MIAAEWIESKTRGVQIFAIICGVPGSSNQCKWGAYYNEKGRSAPTPQNVQQLWAFLGLLHYYAKFIPNLSSILHPLNLLLKSQSSWK